MEYFGRFGFVIVLLAIAGASAQDLSKTCKDTCKIQCTIADQACNLVPGLTATCVSTKKACDGLCDSSCTCLFTCVTRCQKDATDCDKTPGNLVNPILCRAVQVACLETCAPSCGYDIASEIFTQLMSIIVPGPKPRTG